VGGGATWDERRVGGVEYFSPVIQSAVLVEIVPLVQNIILP
jgi:hypothetical protein